MARPSGERPDVQADSEQPGAGAEQPDIAEQAQQRISGGSAQAATPSDLSEATLADHFVATHDDDYRWVQEWRHWHIWNGVRWKADRTVKVYDDIRRTAAAITNAGNGVSDGDRRMLGKAATINGIQTLLRAHRSCAEVPETFDADAELINTPDGIIDLASTSLMPHDRSRFMTKVTRGRLVPDWKAAAPRFSQFLIELTDGDHSLIGYLQRLAGYGCVGSSKEHVLAFLFGPGGNGKGTWASAIAFALNDYAVVMPENFLAEQRGERHPTELSDLFGARFAVASETESGSAWNEMRLKQLTGGDRIKARRMRQDFFEFEPTHTLAVLGNNAPTVRSVDDAMMRRLHVVNLDNAPALPDLTLQTRLEAEADGVLTWALLGAAVWLKDGLKPPKSVLDDSKAYFESQDPIGEWIEDRCDVDPIAAESPTRLSEDYTDFMNSRNEKPLGSRRFGLELEKRGYKRARLTGGIRVRRGLRLKAPGM
jgi:putative DNA primase/helicase